MPASLVAASVQIQASPSKAIYPKFPAQEQQREEQVKGRLLLEIGASPKCQCQQYLSEHQKQKAGLTK